MSRIQVETWAPGNHDLLDNLLCRIGDGAVVVAEDGAVLSWNPAAEGICGVPADDAIGHPVGEVLGEHEPLSRLLESATRHPGTSTGSVPLTLTVDGAPRRVTATAHRIGGSNTLVLLRDRTEVAEMQRTLLEYHQAVETLTDANARLERISHTVAHDLQTPLVAVLGFAQLLDPDRVGQVHPTQVIERIIANAQAAVDMVRSIMGSAGRDGRIRPSVEFPLEGAVRWVVERLSTHVEQVSGSVEVVLPMPHVISVEEVVRQILVNLVSNSVKYRRPDRDLFVRIRAARADDKGHVVVEVADNGLGIPKVERRRVFETGYRSPRDTDIEGTGLGLAQARLALEELGETIWAGDGLDGGTTVMFTLSTPGAQQE